MHVDFLGGESFEELHAEGFDDRADPLGAGGGAGNGHFALPFGIEKIFHRFRHIGGSDQFGIVTEADVELAAGPVEHALFTFGPGIVVVAGELRREYFLKQTGALQQRHIVGAGLDDVGDLVAGGGFFGDPLEQFLGIAAIDIGLDKWIFLAELLSDMGSHPGVRCVEGDLAFFLGAVEENFFAIFTLV